MTESYRLDVYNTGNSIVLSLRRTWGGFSSLYYRRYIPSAKAHQVGPAVFRLRRMYDLTLNVHSSAEKYVGAEYRGALV